MSDSKTTISVSRETWKLVNSVRDGPDETMEKALIRILSSTPKLPAVSVPG